MHGSMGKVAVVIIISTVHIRYKNTRVPNSNARRYKATCVFYLCIYTDRCILCTYIQPNIVYYCFLHSMQIVQAVISFIRLIIGK